MNDYESKFKCTSDDCEVSSNEAFNFELQSIGSDDSQFCKTYEKTSYSSDIQNEFDIVKTIFHVEQIKCD